MLSGFGSRAPAHEGQNKQTEQPLAQTRSSFKSQTEFVNMMARPLENYATR